MGRHTDNYVDAHHDRYWEHRLLHVIVAVFVVGALALTFFTIMSKANAHAGHQEWYPVALWEMNERKDATILRDASGNGLAGKIGRRVTPTDRRFHAFPKEPRDTIVPGHVNRIPDSDALDPGFSDFAVTVRFTWGERGEWGQNTPHDINLVQKGQGSPAGGIFKMKTTVPAKGQPRGHIKCLFRGSTGNSQVESYAGDRLDDGRWHTVHCARTIDGTQMYVDGTLADTNLNQPGEISNDWPVAIGGNTYCEDTASENNVCNYWEGRIGYVRWWKT